MARRDFCTYFDHRYFPRGMALYESLMAHCPGARLWVLCLSPECHAALVKLDLPGVVPVALAEFEAGNAALAAAKANRSVVEYYFTCTPSLMDWILKRDASIETITYLDSDLFFFADPAPIYARFEGYSTLLIEHRFAPALKELEVYGRFNVGWVSFRRDADGLACLAWWRDRCLEWCYDRLEDERFADQKYLDRAPQIFGRVLVLDHPGANLAPWNLASHHVEETRGGLRVDGQPLIFYHFQGFKRLAPLIWRIEHRYNTVPAWRFLGRLLYRPYIHALRRGEVLAARIGLPAAAGLRAAPQALAGRIKTLAGHLLRGDFVIG